MPLDTSVKINACLARIAELRERARADADPALRAKLHDLELQWLGIVESYKVVEQSNRFLKGMRDRQSAREKKSEQTGDLIRANGKHIEAFPSGSGGSLASQLEVLVRAAVEHADGKARAAFYLADATGRELRHIVGMPQAYARHVNGFVISTQSLVGRDPTIGDYPRCKYRTTMEAVVMARRAV